MSADVLQQIDALLPGLTQEEMSHLRDRLDAELGPPAGKSLRGIYKDKFPPDFDLDAALKDVRDEWKGEMDDVAAGRDPR